MAVCFTGGGQPPLVLLVEVKLWSLKHGEGDQDQLKRYLDIADDLAHLPEMPESAVAIVVYLTPRESFSEVMESLRIYGDTPGNQARIFRLHWSSVTECIGEALNGASGLDRLILSDVRSFLQAQGLERFSGFKTVSGLPGLPSGDGGFYQSRSRFSGFHVVEGSELLESIRGVLSDAD